MLTIVHASDIHFGKPHDPTAAAAFREAAAEVGPDVIVVSGDLTQRAKEREYEAARAYLDSLPPVPLVVTPGNHDVPLYRVFERLVHPFRNYRRWIRDELDTVTRVDGAVIVALCSAAPRRAIVNGRISTEQLGFAARALEETPAGAARVVCIHHHLAPAPDYERDKPLPGAKEILERLEELGVDLILSGHLHRAYIGNSLDVFPGEVRDRGIVIVQSGTTTSRRGRARERAKNSFNVVRVGTDTVNVTHFMYFEDAGGFAPFSAHTFPRQRKGFFARDPFEPGTLSHLGEERP